MINPIKLLYTLYSSALRNPKYRWWIISGTLLWLFNPINAIPIVGEVDEAVVITILATEMSQVLLETIKSRKQQETSISNAELAQ